MSEEQLRQSLWTFYLDMESTKTDIDGTELSKEVVQNNQDNVMQITVDNILNML